MKKISPVSILLLSLVGIGLTVFQNCGPGFQLAKQFAPTTRVLPSTHPNTESKPEFDSYQEPLVSKEYLVLLLREILTSSTYPDSDLEIQLHNWVNKKGSAFGSACDIHNTDAGDTCNGDYTSQTGALRTQATTVREINRQQICHQTFGFSTAPEAALEKVNLTVESPINAENIRQVYQLFFRVQEPNDLTINSLLDFANQLKSSELISKEVWRSILFVLCENPGWQQF